MKLVTAIVRTTCVEGIVHELEKAGIRGVTISEVKGTGDQATLNNPYTLHDRIDIIVPDGKASDVERIVLDRASTGLAGDGIVAILPLDSVTKIRTKHEVD